jgi:hypothetical protein
VVRALLVAAVLLAPLVGRAQDISDEAARASANRALRGLRTVGVLIENLPPELAKLGLTREALQSKVELGLRRMGLKVIPEAKATTYLYLQMQGFDLESGLVVYSARLEVHDVATLARTRASRVVTTWSRAILATVGRAKFTDDAAATVGELLDDFENAWRGANQ